MSKEVLCTGDQAIFEPVFSPALVQVQPGILRGSGALKLSGKPVCVAGDEARVTVPGCAYVSGIYTIPGRGDLTIEKLSSDQMAANKRVGGKTVLVKGSTFMARFKVTQRATTPNPNIQPAQDPVSEYPGRGYFVSANTTLRMGSAYGPVAPNAQLPLDIPPYTIQIGDDITMLAEKYGLPSLALLQIDLPPGQDFGTFVDSVTQQMLGDIGINPASGELADGIMSLQRGLGLQRTGVVDDTFIQKLLQLRSDFETAKAKYPDTPIMDKNHQNFDVWMNAGAKDIDWPDQWNEWNKKNQAWSEGWDIKKGIMYALIDNETGRGMGHLGEAGDIFTSSGGSHWNDYQIKVTANPSTGAAFGFGQVQAMHNGTDKLNIFDPEDNLKLTAKVYNGRLAVDAENPILAMSNASKGYSGGTPIDGDYVRTIIYKATGGTYPPDSKDEIIDEMTGYYRLDRR